MERPPLLPLIIGTGFGAGFWPWGPGTAGALLATLVWLALSCVLSPYALIGVTAFLIVLFDILGVWAANKLSPYWGGDPSKVVVDEMVGVWIPLLVCPAENLWYALAAFVLFRFFDILKPLGIRSLDKRDGGIWVMADDVLAGIYSMVLIVLFRWVI